MKPEDRRQTTVTANRVQFGSRESSPQTLPAAGRLSLVIPQTALEIFIRSDKDIDVGFADIAGTYRVLEKEHVVFQTGTHTVFNVTQPDDEEATVWFGFNLGSYY